MHDDERGAETLGEIDCLKSLFDRAFAFFGIGRRKLVTVRRRAQDFHRKRTKIVQAAEFDSPCVVHFLNSGHKRYANAVAELHMIEAKIDNLAEHFITGRMTVRIPASGKGNHDWPNGKSRHRSDFGFRHWRNRMVAYVPPGHGQDREGAGPVNYRSDSKGGA